MFIAIVGTRFAGKSSVQSYLVKHKGFIPVKITQIESEESHVTNPSSDERGMRAGPGPASTFGIGEDMRKLSVPDLGDHPHRVSFLSMVSPVSSNLPSPAPGQEQLQPMVFRTTAQLLAHITKNWRTNFVTLDLNTLDELTEFMTRPFVLVVSVDAPLLTRYRRSLGWSDHNHSLEDFIEEHDTFFYGTDSRESGQATPSHKSVAFAQPNKASFRSLSQIATVHVVNAFQSIPSLQDHLEEVNLLDPERLRPGWDTYFMQLASLASRRSNCMKRRVGAILVRNKRVLSSGYNGTPRGVTNCNEGGCKRCNTASETSDECLCLHAEENALLEAGRERVGDGAVLYCNTCPCLKCTIKIIQTGVKEVVYNLSYKVDDASAALFAEAGVILRRHAPA
ncbi:cytidine deaminase-like protein [Dichomitus squalens]|nr:cytidine deaminase-like protein [Dichomitus squalens]